MSIPLYSLVVNTTLKFFTATCICKVGKNNGLKNYPLQFAYFYIKNHFPKQRKIPGL